MISDSKDSRRRFVIAFIGLLVVLILAMAIGIGVSPTTISQGATALHKSAPIQPAPATGFAAAARGSAEQGTAALSTSDASTITVENGIVKFYFASNKAELALGSAAALDDLIAGARRGGKLLISGYHDPSGDRVRNIELARQRALAVRSILRSAGLSDSQIEVKDPEQMLGSGSAEEARRVEVRLVVARKN